MKKRRTFLLFYFFLASILFFFKYTLINKIETQISTFIQKEKSVSNLEPLIEIADIPKTEYIYITPGQDNNVVFKKDNIQRIVQFNGHEIFSVEKSPSQNLVAIAFNPDSESLNDISIVIYDHEENFQNMIYTSDNAYWDITGDVHWLGNDHVFFLRHCGSGCQGITLVNVHSGDIKTAVLTYISNESTTSKTIFRDWYNDEFEFAGFGGEVTSEVVQGTSYLLFKISNNNGDFIGKKKFLFTGDSLIEVSSSKPNSIF